MKRIYIISMIVMLFTIIFTIISIAIFGTTIFSIWLSNKDNPILMTTIFLLSFSGIALAVSAKIIFSSILKEQNKLQQNNVN